MNQQEINAMMDKLPSQRIETPFQKVYISVLFILLFMAVCWVPDV